jgi:hypothetical protein
VSNTSAKDGSAREENKSTAEVIADPDLKKEAEMTTPRVACANQAGGTPATGSRRPFSAVKVPVLLVT